jgi:DNA-binding transcriptional regulator YdaS (Cro superfamily)
MMKHDSGLRLAIAAAGSERKLGSKIGVSGQAINNWPRVPAELVVKVETATGVPREVLRPDLYRMNELARRR